MHVQTDFLSPEIKLPDVRGVDVQNDTDYIVKGFSESFLRSYQKVYKHITQDKLDTNVFAYSLRIFKIPPNATLGFVPIENLRQQCRHVIKALYIFKFNYPYSDGFTHGAYIRFKGFVQRRIFDQFFDEVVQLFTGMTLELRPMMPRLKKSMSLSDYLQTLYVLPKNLFVNFSHYHDAVSKDQSDVAINHQSVMCLKDRISRISSQILDNMVTIPSKYPKSYIMSLIQTGFAQFKSEMKQLTLDDMIFRVASDAYNLSLQDSKFTQWDVQELMDPVSKRSIIHKLINEKVIKQVQYLIHQTFGQSFVHPHQFTSILKHDLSHVGPIDAMIFDAKFLFPLLMVSRWFSKVCMRAEHAITNNHAHLFLYGNSGTGKSLIVSSISSVINTYKYLVGSRFQNPDMLQSSLFLIEEFDSTSLPDNHYKQLFDLKSHIKIDFKNLHPENVSEGVPCMITSNDDVITQMKAQRKYNSQSVDAAIRRLYLVPMKLGMFDKIHSKINPHHKFYSDLMMFDNRFENEPDRLYRIFNFIVTFSLFQQDLKGYDLNIKMIPYFQKLLQDFQLTVFSSFYMLNKQKIDQLITQVEQLMSTMDINDTEFYTEVAICAGQLHHMQQQYLLDSVKDIVQLNDELIMDSTVPWPLKVYYCSSSFDFIAKQMWHLKLGLSDALNSEIYQLLNLPQFQPFTDGDQQDQSILTDRYDELQREDSSDGELWDPFLPNTSESEFADVEELQQQLGKKKTFNEHFGIEEVMSQTQNKLIQSDVGGGGENGTSEA